jgi:xanthine dehydrogenase accessory factor
MRNVLRHVIEALEQDRELIVCQVIETRGSTPQKAGSMMVIDPDGGQAGTLGGGCVENEVKTKAMRQIGECASAVHSFVLDHDYAWADGLICGGRMMILTQPVRGPEPLSYFRAIDRMIEEGQGFTEAIVVSGEHSGSGAVGSRYLFDGEGRMRLGWPADEVPGGLPALLPRPAERRRPAVKGGFAFLPSWPRIRLVVVGAGHVGQAVAGLAAQADFDVWVLDDRHQYASAARFPAAQRILVGPIEELLPSLEITPQTYALIVTRGHGHDQEALHLLAPTRASYVGLIGSRRKIRLIFDNLRAAGVKQSDLDRVTAPVGLEIGSQSVFEIAVSIVAELIARRNLGQEAIARRADGESNGSVTTGATAGAGVTTPA